MKNKKLCEFFRVFNKSNRKVLLLLIPILIFGLFVVFSFAVSLLYEKEVKSISFSSLGYDSDQGGSVFVKKSAEWTGLHEATIEIKVNTKPALKDVDRDIILVLDTSESMTEERIEEIKAGVRSVSNEIFKNENDRLAIISFNTNSTINTGFTRDASLVEKIIENMSYKGATNYYLALKDVETLLKDYQVQNNRELYLVFITDGYPTEGKGLYEAQYKMLKQEHPYMISTAIQYELGSEVISPLVNISDYQYSASTNGLVSALMTVVRSSYYYTSFTLEDVINKDYFQINSVDDISVQYGSVKIVDDNGSQKVVWEFPDRKLKTGSSVKMKIKVKVKEDYQDVKGYFPTNSGTSVNATSNAFTTVVADTKDTPVLKSWYDVTYYSNDPCNINLEKTVYHFPFSSVYIPNDVSIPNDKKLCGDYQFKNWRAEDDTIKFVGDDTFIMPLEDIVINGTWTSLSIGKSMDGTIKTRSTFYEILSEKATMDNVSSTYVSSEGINFNNISSSTNGQGLYTYSSTSGNTYPIQYYRGDVNDNNVLFGGFCWKIVRTTDAGGVKLIYNGLPSGNNCTATTGASTIATSSGIYNSATSDDVGSLAMAGYVYGKQYNTEQIELGFKNWGNAVGIVQTQTSNSNYFTTPFYYSDDYRTFDKSSGVKSFKLDGTTYLDVASKDLIGKYTVFNSDLATAPSSGYLSYVIDVDLDTKTIYYVRFNRDNNDEAVAHGMKLYDYFYNKAWYYSNDVTYENGVYTLVDPVPLKPAQYGDNIDVVKNKYHYTCMNSEKTCSSVKYIFHDSEQFMTAYYITLTDGDKIEDAVANMITNSSNATSSDIKKAVDSWYQSNMTSYTYMLEDTVWCNDRGISTDEQYAGWLKDGNSTEYLHFNGAKNSTNSFILNEESTCSSNDKLTVSSGRLDYPVGLITVNEARFAGAKYETKNTSYYLYNGQDYWTMTPNRFNNTIPYINLILSTGSVFRPLSSGTSSKSLSQSYGIRPMVSLKPGVFLTDGDGTSTNPYVIEME